MFDLKFIRMLSNVFNDMIADVSYTFCNYHQKLMHQKNFNSVKFEDKNKDLYQMHNADEITEYLLQYLIYFDKLDVGLKYLNKAFDNRKNLSDKTI